MARHTETVSKPNELHSGASGTLDALRVSFHRSETLAEQIFYKIIQTENAAQAQQQMQIAANEGYRFLAFAPDARSNRITVVMEKRTV